MDGAIQAGHAGLLDAWGLFGGQNTEEFALTPNANRLAFADPEFLLRPETRGLRFQLELLKPELALRKAEISKTIVVFGSARFFSNEEAMKGLERARSSQDALAIKKAERQVLNSRYYEAARSLGRTVTQAFSNQPLPNRFYICTGGGPGIMEAANRGAQEAGGISIGLNIALPHEQRPNNYITSELSFQFHYFALRKMHFMMRAKGLVAFPGGFGTLDELFEALTLIQTKKVKPIPIILFGCSYWKRLINFEQMVEDGVIEENDCSLFHLVDDVEGAWRGLNLTSQ
jgi:uncharacterized protein (TIGR00730 family)